MFVKGNISFHIDSHFINFESQKISSFGVTGLPWQPLDPETHYGKSVFVNVEIRTPVPLNFVVAAQIIREYTPAKNTMGLMFHFEEQQLAAFTEFAKKHGEPPITYTRKFPRIPSNYLIQVYPLQVSTPVGGHATHFDCEDISPDGLMIFTENKAAFSLKVQQKIELKIDPGHFFPHQLNLEASVRRISDDFNPASGAPVRHMGLQFVTPPENEKKKLNELLKDILLQLKEKMKSGSN